MSSLADTIVKIRYFIDNNTLKQHEDDPELKHLYETQPKLYKMVVSPDCDLAMLYKFVTLLEKVQSGSLNREDADKEFGEVAAKRYVYPLVDKET